MSKFNGPLLLVSETFGGVNGRAVRYLTRLSHMARSARRTRSTSIARDV